MYNESRRAKSTPTEVIDVTPLTAQQFEFEHEVLRWTAGTHD